MKARQEITPIQGSEYNITNLKKKNRVKIEIIARRQ